MQTTRRVRRSGAIVTLVAVGALGIIALTGCSSTAISSSGKSIAKNTAQVLVDGKTSVVPGGSRVTAKAGTTTIELTEADLTVTCDDGAHLVLSGVAGKLSLAGSCGDVEVRSAGLRVVAKSVDRLKAEGLNLNMTAGEVGSAELRGAGNRLNADQVGPLDLEGVDNKVTYGELRGAVEKNGINNEAMQR